MVPEQLQPASTLFKSAMTGEYFATALGMMVRIDHQYTATVTGDERNFETDLNRANESTR